MFIILVSTKVPGILEYTLNLYQLLTDAYNMSMKHKGAGESHTYWQRAAGGFPVPR